MSNNVIRYTPQAVKDNNCFTGLYKVEKTEIDDIYAMIGHVVDNSYIDTIEGERVAEWEEVLGLTVDTSKQDSLRIKSIKDYLNFQPPITRYKLQDILDSKYGPGNYYLKILKESFEVIIGVEDRPEELLEYMYGWLKNNKKTYKVLTQKKYSVLMKFRGQTGDSGTELATLSFEKFLRNIIPANMLLTLGIKYMYSYFRGLYTYSELEQYTYKYMSQYSDYDCPDRDAKPSFFDNHNLVLSPQYWEWHTVPSVEDHTLLLDGQDTDTDGTVFKITVELKEEYR